MFQECDQKVVPIQKYINFINDQPQLQHAPADYTPVTLHTYPAGCPRLFKYLRCNFPDLEQGVDNC